MSKPEVRYPYIIAYCRYMRSRPYWVRSQIEQAVDIKAPEDTYEVDSGEAKSINSIKNTMMVEDLKAIVKRGVVEPPPEHPCPHCGEDDSDGFHQCEGTDAEEGVI